MDTVSRALAIYLVLLVILRCSGKRSLAQITAFDFVLLLILVIVLGIHHPPTADDSVELDDFRWILGVAAMAIPVLCFPLQALKQ